MFLVAFCLAYTRPKRYWIEQRETREILDRTERDWKEQRENREILDTTERDKRETGENRERPERY